MKPGDFLLSVLDFFGILLPGAIATWLVTRYVPPRELARMLSFGFGPETASPDPAVIVAAFLLASYTLGHFVFMAGSRLDASYDRWRKRAKPKNRDKAYLAAEKIQQGLTADLVGGEFSTLKWARAYIQVQAAQARVEIDRLEADHKFFRSMVVVSVALALHFVLRERAPVMGLAALLMAVLSYHRYREQRWKMTELSYGTAVIVHATRHAPSAAAAGVPSAAADD